MFFQARWASDGAAGSTEDYEDNQDGTEVTCLNGPAKDKTSTLHHSSDVSKASTILPLLDYTCVTETCMLKWMRNVAQKDRTESLVGNRVNW